MKHPTENFKKYPVLEELSTEKLNELLQQDFAASEETGPDVEFITAIMEVIAQRNALEATDEEAEASLRQFHAQAMPQETLSTEEPKPEAPSREPNVVPFPSPRKSRQTPPPWPCRGRCGLRAGVPAGGAGPGRAFGEPGPVEQ